MFIQSVLLSLSISLCFGLDDIDVAALTAVETTCEQAAVDAFQAASRSCVDEGLAAAGLQPEDPSLVEIYED